MKIYYNLDVLKAIDEKPDTFNAWLREGFVKPSVSKASGQGTRNIFNRADLFNIMLFKTLLKTASNRNEASNISKGALINWEKMEKDGGNFVLCFAKKIDEKQELRILPVIKLANNSDEVNLIEDKIKSDYDAVFIINLTKIIRQVIENLGDSGTYNPTTRECTSFNE